MASLAKSLVFIGLAFIALGGFIYMFSRMNIPIGRLPGDIKIVRENFTCVIALGTSILLSILLTIALNLFNRFLNK